MPAKAHFVQLVCADSGELQAGSNGQVWEAGIVLYTAHALFSYGKEQFAVPHYTCGGIMHL